ncbi:hypothetical protein [Cryobacterium psychrophilum]|uniref:Uncharacterized protein n=1 Tax=Cryobacterium psychrophilum TaxID=41988 RepID=A0A4Y8KWL1_9MICO|nr:hypothetical protein [Cryobacterium psychrophilum]TDW28713.1 hypothetical protein EDD25_0345 [Cryobacterium psychrophilum]TFD82375.1 hypothetical protein E3T53_00405 [Cryobacterium psychrophilum]
MRISNPFAELRLWAPRRRIIALGVASITYVVLSIASGAFAVVGGALAFPGSWWAYALTVIGSGMLGLVVASYFSAPIGGEATRCDLRWPVLSLIAMYLATDMRTVEPIFTGAVRPVVALAAVALLAWALRERLTAEHRAMSDTGDGATCSTCRPLFG